MKNIILKITATILFFLILSATNIRAQPAMNCISITEGEQYGKPTYKLKNICNKSIVVSWCLEGIDSDTKCGTSDKDLLYTKAREIDPNETYSSTSRLNSNYQIRYAVCFGDNSWTTRPHATNRRGDFVCEE